MESEATTDATAVQDKLPKNCKENRYYYRHREEILEKRRLDRLKTNVDNLIFDCKIVAALKEKRKNKTENAK